MNRIILFLLLIIFHPVFAQDAQSLYRKNCQVCHGLNRIGAMAPALLPENLKYLRKKQAIEVITNGRVATQMQGFKGKLTTQQIKRLADYIYTPGIHLQWQAKDINKSRKIFSPNRHFSDKPVFSADPLNLFTIVELGDHHASILDGDKLEVIHRLKTPFAVHGGPKYSPTGRYVYFGSRDGWILKYDLYNLSPIAQVRVGINMRNIALSSNGKYLIAANYLPHTLVILDASDLSLIKIINARNNQGKSSRVSAVYNAPPRHSFIVAFKDINELWEINYADSPPPGFGQWVHDYRQEIYLDQKQNFPIRKIKLDLSIDDFFFDQNYISLIGSSRKGFAQVIDLDLGRSIKTLKLDGMPHLGSGITWTYKGKRVLATPNLRKPQITIYDTNTWKVIKNIPTKGSGFFLRSHKNSRYA